MPDKAAELQQDTIDAATEPLSASVTEDPLEEDPLAEDPPKEQDQPPVK